MGRVDFQRVIILSVLVIGSGTAIVLVWWVYPGLPEQVPEAEADPMELLQIVVPGIFSLTLVILYSSMSRTQSKQAALQETQKELDKVQHKPILNIKRIELTRDVVEFELENIGNGVAEDLEVNAHLYCDTTDPTVDGVALSESKYQNKLVQNDGGHYVTSIGAGDVASFSTTVYLPSQEHPSFDEKFSSVIRSLKDCNNGLSGTAYLQFELQYAHQMPEHGRARQFIQPIEVDLADGELLEELLEGPSSKPAEKPAVFKSPATTLRIPQTTYY